MGNEVKRYWKSAPVWAKAIFWTLLILCFIIFVIALVEPPEWDINPNVLKGIAMFMGFASFGVGVECLEKGMELHLKHGDTEVSLERSQD